MNSSTPGIRGIELGKSYHNYQVLNEITFEVGPGECFALFGSNGAGKTTLFKILATLQRPSKGRFEMMGYDGIRERSKVRETLLFISHGSYLYNDLNATENIRFALAFRSIFATPREIKIVLDRVGIGAFSELKIRSYSEGMKKRLAMAKAILFRPKVLLLDEPYSSLDERGMTMVNEFIRTMTERGTSVMMTSHNRVKTAEVAHQVGVLKNGVIQRIDVKELVTANELF